MNTDRKQEGQYMTPSFIVNIILDSLKLNGKKILDKKIMEPSFGDGAFLQEIVKRIIKEADKENVCDILNENIFGIEKDIELYNKAISNLNEILKENNLPEIEWKNLINGDTLVLYKNYIHKFDYVIGNPPFVNIHNIKEEYRDILKDFNFTSGTIDLYIIFYEVGIQLLDDDGMLGFISPNSFIINKSQKKYRDYLLSEKLLKTIINFKDSKIFKDAQTYTCICVLDKNNRKEDLHYLEYKDGNCIVDEVFTYDLFNDTVWNLGSKEDVLFLNSNRNLKTKVKDIATVQNTVCTNRDSVYIFKVYEDENLSIPYMGKHTDKPKIVWFSDKENHIYKIESNILRRVVKETRFNGVIDNTYILYPYKETVLISEDKLKKEYPLAYHYLCSEKEELCNRDMEKNSPWYAFARSQGILNMDKQKVIIKRWFEKSSKIIPYLLEEDIVVYAGLYTTSENLDKVMKIYSSDEFLRYCSLKGRDMQNEYVGLSTTILKNFGIQ